MRGLCYVIKTVRRFWSLRSENRQIDAALEGVEIDEEEIRDQRKYTGDFNLPAVILILGYFRTLNVFSNNLAVYSSHTVRTSLVSVLLIISHSDSAMYPNCSKDTGIQSTYRASTLAKRPARRTVK